MEGGGGGGGGGSVSNSVYSQWTGQVGVMKRLHVYLRLSPLTEGSCGLKLGLVLFPSSTMSTCIFLSLFLLRRVATTSQWIQISYSSYVCLGHLLAMLHSR